MIEVRSVTKRYGPALAVDDVSFSVGRSEVVGFLGPNGAGKSTTMRILTGYIPATEGEALVDGFAVSEKPSEVKRRIGYLPENNPLYEDLRVREYLSFRAALKGVPGKGRAREVERVIGACEVGDAADRIIGVCSKGYRQRVGLADALLGDPPVLVLDEPTVGLDPQQIVHVRDLIRALAKEHTVVLSTHVLPEVEAICSRALIIHKGRICFDGSVEALRAGLAGGAVLSCEVAGDPEEAKACLASAQGVERVEEVSRSEGSATFRVFADKSFDVRKEVFWACSRASLPLLEMTRHRASVEEAFLDITTQETPREVQP